MVQIPGRANIWRLGMLAVFLIGVLGPWTYSSDGVPPLEYCQAPNFILDERCVRSVPGSEIFLFFMGAAISIPVGLVMGSQDPSGRAREFLSILLFLTPGIPLVATLLLLRRETTGLRILYALGWGLVIFLCLFIVGADTSLLSIRVWGLWLSLAAAASALVLEGVRSFSLQRDPEQNQPIQ